MFEVNKKWVKGYNPAVHHQNWKLPRRVFESVWKKEGMIVWKPTQLDLQRSLSGMALPLPSRILYKEKKRVVEITMLKKLHVKTRLI